MVVMLSSSRTRLFNFTIIKSLTVQRTYSRKCNSAIILLGSPGSGKTTVGRILGVRLGRPVVDIDNDYLEKYWKSPVSQKLESIGGDRFLDEEGQALMKFNASPDSVISLTGSNPMHKDAMDHIRKQGVLVFLDVVQEDILKRLEAMKVNRIVGQSSGMSMADILQYRQQFYERSYDIRVVCEEGDDPETVAERVHSALENYQSKSTYVSTRGDNSGADFNDVVLRGLAPDGGLYIPESFPRFSLAKWKRLIDLPYYERALRILEHWIHPDEIHPSSLREMTKLAYSRESGFTNPEVFPVVPLYKGAHLLELFHGPTASFKDAALQLMPRFFKHAMQSAQEKGSLDPKTKFLILVATSGDTGGAVLYGFQKLASQPDGGVRVLVLYPENGVSDLQRHQMTSVPANGLHVVGVKSDFDFCQSAIKDIFNDSDIAKRLENTTNFKLSAANSINWGRLLPQVVYHASGYLDLVKQGVIALGDTVDICIPTGNFGNILAAHYAKEMGIPIGRMICASNMNNVLTSFINTGSYDLSQRRLHVTSSPAIDILKSSNLERYLFHLSGNDSGLVSQCYKELSENNRFQVSNDLLHQMKKTLVADWCTEEECKRTISDTFRRHGYILDPHTAVAVNVAQRLHTDSNRPLIISSTAHYAKFPEHVLPAIKSRDMQNQSRGDIRSRSQVETEIGQQKNEEIDNNLDYNEADTYENMEPNEMLAKLDACKGKPQMHKILRDSVSKPVVHTRVLNDDKDIVLNEMLDFIDSEKEKSW